MSTQQITSPIQCRLLRIGSHRMSRPIGLPWRSNDQNLWMALGLVTWTGAPSRG